MEKKKSRFSSITHTIKFITGIISWVILVILVLIAAFLVYYFVATKIYTQKGEDYKPAFSLYTILTQSMEPNISPYDVIVDIAVNDPTDIQIGDVITFISTSSLSSGMTVTHRVYDIKEIDGEYYYYTKGDNNISPDAVPASYSNVLGKVLFKIPQLGRIQSFLSTKGGWLIVVVIPALIVIISDLVKIFRLMSTKNKVDNKLIDDQAKKQKQEAEKKEIEAKLALRYRDKKNEQNKNDEENVIKDDNSKNEQDNEKISKEENEEVLDKTLEKDSVSEVKEIELPERKEEQTSIKPQEEQIPKLKENGNSKKTNKPNNYSKKKKYNNKKGKKKPNNNNRQTDYDEYKKRFNKEKERREEIKASLKAKQMSDTDLPKLKDEEETDE